MPNAGSTYLRKNGKKGSGAAIAATTIIIMESSQVRGFAPNASI
jgi:predicted outer membrane repeat protein